MASGTTVNAGGPVSLKTLANTDVLANADGSTKGDNSVGVGAAISINVANITNEANTEGATVTANGIDIEAGMNGGDGTTATANDPIYRWNTSGLTPEWDLVDSGSKLPTTASDKDYFFLTMANEADQPGVYQFNGTTKKWSLVALQTTITQDAALPDAGASSNQLIQIPAHQVEATSTSGASSSGDAAIAGSFAMNLTSNDTEAVLGSKGGTVPVTDTAGTGDLTLKATTQEVDTANAKATVDADSEKNNSSSDGGSGDGSKDSSGAKVGVGASIALNILTSEGARAEVENNVVVAAANNVDIEATSTRTLKTDVEAGVGFEFEGRRRAGCRPDRRREQRGDGAKR